MTDFVYTADARVLQVPVSDETGLPGLVQVFETGVTATDGIGGTAFGYGLTIEESVVAALNLAANVGSVFHAVQTADSVAVANIAQYIQTGGVVQFADQPEKLDEEGDR
jgi:hypothetical protein